MCVQEYALCASLNVPNLPGVSIASVTTVIQAVCAVRAVVTEAMDTHKAKLAYVIKNWANLNVYGGIMLTWRKSRQTPLNSPF